MKNLAVCGIVLALAALAPALEAGSFSAAAWGLGTLLLLAIVAQRAAQQIGFPAIVGWLAAGFAIGASGLDLIDAPTNQTLLTLRTLALLWLAFQVGLGATSRWNDSRVAALVIATTLVAQLLVTLALTLTSDFRFDQALLLGALACLWGPLVLTSLAGSAEVRRMSITGAAASLVLFGSTLVVLRIRGSVGPEADQFVLMLMVSCAAGAICADLLWRLGILSQRHSAILGMVGLSGVVALLLQPLGLYAVPFGICGGLVVSQRQGQGRLVTRLFDSSRPFCAMVFFTLAAASVSLHGPLWPLEKGLAQFVLIQLLILIALRGVVPTLWFGKEFGADFDRRAIWLLVPKGVLLFELVHGPGLRLPALVDGGLTRFLYQLVVADLLVYAVGFSVVATLFQRVRASRQVVSSTD